MVSDNIIVEVRRKYELRPKLNTPNFKREEMPKKPKNARREETQVS
jgi:hypothetical protein